MIAGLILELLGWLFVELIGSGIAKLVRWVWRLLVRKPGAEGE